MPGISARDGVQVLKVILIGPRDVGKTSLLLRFHTGLFPDSTMSTVGVSFVCHSLEIDGSEVELQLWDTAGQEKFASLAANYYRDAACCIAVFDVSAPSSLQEMTTIVDRYCNLSVGTPFIVIVGNKTDCRNDASDAEIQRLAAFAQEKKAKFFSTSAKTGEGINGLFDFVASELVRPKPGSKRPALVLSSESSSCCS
jgi:small GTP-binding protein